MGVEFTGALDAEEAFDLRKHRTYDGRLVPGGPCVVFEQGVTFKGKEIALPLVEKVE